MANSERLAIVLVLIGAASRLLHLPPNIAAVTGVTIFAGYAIRNAWLALIVPLAAMALADVVLGWYPDVLFTYGGMAAGVFIARALLRPLTPVRLVATTLLSSLVFFALSNFGVWTSGYYGYTFDGLVACFVAAIPFWQNSLIADFTSTALVFGLYLLARRALPSVGVKA
ncbi:MAG: hypothetical protein HY834_04505 [Devosia nanyangense]|uniref:Uncharacterized protein n=1 Tax=Devosia nanyangense TaxID=1228055 RepID=A0A933L021_9HYPH|nr:hypothetical protein [Devosia nanyangense]